MILILATRNRHKTEEIQAVLGERFEYRTLNDFPGAPEVVEDAGTFAGNATKKAVELAGWLAGAKHAEEGKLTENCFVLADDSGLEVDALQGAPGVYSARFAATGASADVQAPVGNSPDAANNAKLLRLLERVPLEKRTSRFRCVLALTPVLSPGKETGSPVCYADEAELETELFDGVCEGRISFSGSGKAGFGYDPLFVPAGYEVSFAELGEGVKNKISHRARALEKLRSWQERRSTGR